MREFDKIRKNILSQEKGTIIKSSYQLRVASGFPNRYEVGIANLGFQTIYRILNQIEGVSCERFFLFDYKPQDKVRTLESGDPLNFFQIISFSVPFELDYLNVLKILKQAKIPLLSKERDENHPFLLAGGVAVTLNPEVMASFFDAIFIGEAEEGIVEVAEIFKKGHDRKRTLQELAKVKGVYVPESYKPIYDEKGFLKEYNIEQGFPSKIENRKADLEKIETYSSIVTPLSHFKDMFIVETERGCAWKCRFCAVGHLYKPFRPHKKEKIIYEIEKYAGGSKSVGLLGSMVSDLPFLEELCCDLYQKGYQIGVSSLRVDKVTPGLLDILIKSGLKTLTLAPEAGTERMWKIIDKRIDREDVLYAARLAREKNLEKLKLYFIIGLPFEKTEDIEGIVDLVKEIHNIFVGTTVSLSNRGEARSSTSLRVYEKKQIILSVNPFVPKAHTPFQWAPMDSEKSLREKLKIISDGVRSLKGVKFEKKSIKEAILQGVLSQGNRKVGMGLYYHIKENLPLTQAFKKAEVDTGFLAFKEKPKDYLFPWEIIEMGIKAESP
ncbi:MAG: radical SAM protein [candidate division Zixibacteria bacterium]|nr:radical SAM protein [candidate division Zixibacteria bacterium]